MYKVFKTILLSISLCAAGVAVAHAAGTVGDFAKFRGLLGTIGGAGAAATCVAFVWGTWYGKRVANREIAGYDAYLKNNKTSSAGRR